MTARYAIYWTPGRLPEEGAVAARLGELGELQLREHPTAAGYGFHATIKAPFRLAAGRSVEEVEERLAAFAAARQRLALPGLRLASWSGIWALVPAAESPPLQRLAAEAVRVLDVFRAPLSDAELARRRPERLTARQRELLADWGYPYVLDEYRPHLTLSDAPDPDPAATERALRGRFAEVLGRPVPIASLSLSVQERPGARFQVRSAHPLSESVPPAATKEQS